MEHRALDDSDAATVVTVCPSCAARARAFQQPAVRGLRLTSVVVFGADGNEAWTVMARRGESLAATATGASEEEALFDVLEHLGVLS